MLARLWIPGSFSLSVNQYRESLGIPGIPAFPTKGIKYIEEVNKNTEAIVSSVDNRAGSSVRSKDSITHKN